jgi:hypothetical protein
MENSHASESGDVNLHGDVFGEIGVNLGLLGRMNSRVQRSSSVVEAPVSDFIDHLLITIFIIISNLNLYISIDNA